MTTNTNSIDNIAAVVHDGTGTVLSAHETRVIRGERADAAIKDGGIFINIHDDRTVAQLLSDLERAEKSREHTFGMLTDLRQAVQRIVDECRDCVHEGTYWNMREWDDFDNAFSVLDKFGINVERPRTEFTATVSVSATFTVSGYTLGEIDDVKEALENNGDWSISCDFLNFEDRDDVTVEQDGTYITFEADYIDVEES